MKKKQFLMPLIMLLMVAMVFAGNLGNGTKAMAKDHNKGKSSHWHPHGTAYFIAPNGSDSNNGRSRNHPWKTFDHAIAQLDPGETLVLMDGVYTKDENGYFKADCSIDSGYVSSTDANNEKPGLQEESWRELLSGTKAQNGTAKEPITVIAQNQRQAWIKGDGSDVPFMMYRCSHWNINGLHVSSADNPDSKFFQGNAIRVQEVSYVNMRNLIVDHNNRWLNGGLLQIATSDHVLVEDSELYYFHRNGLGAYQSDYVTVRRDYINSRGYSDLDKKGAYHSHAISRDGGDAAVVFYYTSNSTIENTISENKNEGFTLGISGFRTFAGHHSARNNKLLGSISLRDNRSNNFAQTRIRSNNPDETAGKAAKNLYVENLLMLNSQRKGATMRAVKGLTVKNLTAINIPSYEGAGVINLNAEHQEVGKTTWPSCEEVGGCEYDFYNSLFLDNGGKAITARGTDNWVIHNSNFWNNEGPGFGEPIGDEAGNVRDSQSVKPTGIGLDYGQCVVYVPEDSNMSGAGKNGADIGANILYRYHNGELTDKPLWDPETGQFPHGAIVEGLNDIPGKSAFDVNKRLNVNYNGCTLPYSK